MFETQWSWMRMAVLSVALVGAGATLDKLQDGVDDVSRTVDGAKQVLDGVDSLLSGGKSKRDKERPLEAPAEEKNSESATKESEEEDSVSVTGASVKEDRGSRSSSKESKHFRNEWYVSPSGSDKAPGSRQEPFRTIGRAIVAAGPGDAIRVKSGKYAERIVIDGKAKAGKPGAPITLLGEGKPKIVPGNGSGTLVQVRRPYWRVEGFEIDVQKKPSFAVAFEGNTRGSSLARSEVHHGSLGGGVTTFGNARGVTIEDNHIHHFRKPKGDSHGVVVQATSRDITIRGNDIHDNSGDSVQCLKPDKKSQAPARGLVIENNKLHGNDENAVDIKTCRDVIVRSNRMHDFRRSASSAGEAVVVHYSAENVRIEDNRISKAGRGISVGGVTEGRNPSNVVVKGNDIRDISSKGGSDGAGIRVENASGVQVLDNKIEETDGYGMMLGLGANGAPSRNLTVKNNTVRGSKLIRLGGKRPGLKMASNRYSRGGMFKVDPKETKDLNQWKAASGVDKDAVQD